jgi:hypothetical protein
MIRTTLFAALATSAVLASQASAQIIVPPGQKPPLPKIEGLPPDLQKELERLLDPNLTQLNRQPAAGGMLRWGGLRLKKATPAEQENLGLPEGEGLVIAGVDPNSVADKSGLKANDVLVKLNKKAVPNDPQGFAKLVKENNANDPVEIVVLRGGKEETIKDAKMPLLVQNMGGAGGGIGGAGGLQIRPGGLIVPRIQINPRNPALPNPLIPNIMIPQGNIDNLNLEVTINGAKYVRKQKGNEFSGEYSKDDLVITVAGKIENGAPKASEITIREGKGDAKKYTSILDTPGQHRMTIQQLMPSTANNQLFQFPMIPFPNLPGLDD